MRMASGGSRVGGLFFFFFFSLANLTSFGPGAGKGEGRMSCAYRTNERTNGVVDFFLTYRSELTPEDLIDMDYYMDWVRLRK